MAGETRRATLKDVARAAGVSVGMASRVLAGYGSYSEATKTKVVAAARALDYRPNAVARSLRVGRTKALGVVVANLASFSWTAFVRGVETTAARRGYQVILGHTHDDAAVERAHIRSLYQRNVDGLIISPSRDNERDLRQLVEAGFPVILMESDLVDLPTPRINIADHRAAYEATRYLLGLRHRRIGLVAGSQHLASGVDRRQGYLDALRDGGVDTDEGLIGYGDYRFDAAYRATERLMTSADPPTALLVSNETMTGATLQCLKDRRTAIPDEVSLIAFDDPPWASFFAPALTSIRTPRERMGSMAVEALLALIAGGTDAPGLLDEQLIQTEFIERESCRAL